MALLDLRHVGDLFIWVLTNRPFQFELIGDINCPVLTGCSAVLTIKQGDIVKQNLIIGAGLTVTAANKIAVYAAALPKGVYDYSWEITPVTGEVILVFDQIQVTNE